MVRSRSRSPRWKKRSLSPTFRSQEHSKQRHNNINYDDEYKGFWKDRKKPVPWRMEDAKHGQADSRYPPHDIHHHHRIHERGSRSPTLRRIPSEDIHSHIACRTHSPERNDNIRRSQFLSRYSEMSHKEHNQSFYPTKGHEREKHEYIRVAGNTKGIETFQRPLGTPCKSERKWNENDLRHPPLQDNKYIQSPRRISEECVSRSLLLKRYPEDRDYREPGHSSKRVKEMERYDGREAASNSKWKQDYPSTFNQEKGEGRNLGLQTHRPIEKKFNIGCETKITYDYSHKCHRLPDERKYLSDDRAENYMKLEDRRNNYHKGAWNYKYSDCYSKARGSQTEKSLTEVSIKHTSEKGCNSCAKSYKSDAGHIHFNLKEKERIKKEGNFMGERDFPNSCEHGNHYKVSSLKVSDVHTRKERLTVKVDMKKTLKYRGTSSHITERQTSCDLVAVGRKTEKFHPVFEHIKSVMQKAERKPSKEFAQEIITIIHEVKANYFKSSGITLHERFSQIQDNPVTNEVKRCADPEIHRRIDMSLAELQNKRAIPCESGQSVVRTLADPNDLRHDIERRRKERLQSEEERVFYSSGVLQRDEHSCNFLKQQYGFQNPARVPKSTFRRFIRKPHMNYNTAKSEDEVAYHRFGTENSEASRTPFKLSFNDGRPHFKSKLVQKGLCIQAKYHRLRYAGTRGFTTAKFRGGFLRKEKGMEV